MEAASSSEMSVIEQFLYYQKMELASSFETSVQRHIPEDCDTNNCVNLKSRKVVVLWLSTFTRRSSIWHGIIAR